MLYYFSILARYYPAQWQGLLAADEGPEGYVFRVAMEHAARDYLDEMVTLLPYMTPPPTFGREAVTEKRPAIETWHTPHEVSTSALQGIRYPL